MKIHNIYIKRNELERLPEIFVNDCEQVNDELYKVKVVSHIEADFLQDQINSLQRQLDERNGIWLARYEKLFDAMPTKMNKRDYMLPRDAYNNLS